MLSYYKSEFGVCVREDPIHGDSIYLIGGYNIKGEFHRSCDKYIVNENRWTFVAGLNFRRAKPSVCIINGYMYTIGGISN